MTKTINNVEYFDSLYFSTLIGSRKDNYSRWVKRYVYRGYENFDYTLNKNKSTVTRKRYWLSKGFCQALCVAHGTDKALISRRKFL